jgi:hypothetical protein
VTDQPRRSERPSERAMREAAELRKMAEAEARPTQEPEDWTEGVRGQPSPVVPLREIIIQFQEEPRSEDWTLMTRLLGVIESQQPLMDLDQKLVVRIVPVAERADLKRQHRLRLTPVLETTDAEFVMWHFADGSDSEG